jgi:hypothetical protein
MTYHSITARAAPIKTGEVEFGFETSCWITAGDGILHR